MSVLLEIEKLLQRVERPSKTELERRQAVFEHTLSDIRAEEKTAPLQRRTKTSAQAQPSTDILKGGNAMNDMLFWGCILIGIVIVLIEIFLGHPD